MSKQNIVTVTLVAVWCVLVVIVSTVTIKLNRKTEIISNETAPVVVETQEDVVYSELTDVSFSSENLINALSSTGLSTTQINSVVEILLKYAGNPATWKVRYTEDLCGVVDLLVDDSERSAISISCYTENSYVTLVDTYYVFYKDGYYREYTGLYAESILELFNRVSDSWDLGSAVWAYGLVEFNYKDTAKSIVDNYIYSDVTPVAIIDDASILLGTTVYTPYTKVASDTMMLVEPQENWLVPEALGSSTIRSLLSDNGLSEPLYLDEALLEFGSVHDYWYFIYENNELYFYTIRIGEGYGDKGYVEYPLGVYSYTEELWRF